MAIIIPSKNIYDKNNNIIRNNVINKVEVTQRAVEIKTQTEDVYNQDFSVSNDDFVYSIDTSTNGSMILRDIDDIYYGWVAAYYSLYVIYIDITITIPISSDNKYIETLFTGVDKNDNPQIQYSISGVKITGTASTNNAVLTHTSGNNINISINDTPSYSNINETQTIFSLKAEDISNSYTYSYSYYPTNSSLIRDTISTTVTLNSVEINDGNISTATYTIENDNYVINLNLLAGYRAVRMGGGTRTAVSSSTTSTTISMSGDYEEQTPTQLNLSFNGITIGINLNDEIVTLGNGNKPFTLSSNELIQKTNTYTANNVQKTAQVIIGANLSSAVGNSRYELYLISGTLDIGNNLEYNGEVGIIQDFEDNGDYSYYTIRVPTNGEFANSSGTITANLVTSSTENAVTKMANSILTKYANGLQNATVLCSISDYYDENGNLVITKDGSKDMVFRMHDEVIPYVYSANGTDIPMALKQDGSPKVFRVIGTKIYYDGAVWQELTLKEIPDN